MSRHKKPFSHPPALSHYPTPTKGRSPTPCPNTPSKPTHTLIQRGLRLLSNFVLERKPCFGFRSREPVFRLDRHADLSSETNKHINFTKQPQGLGSFQLTRNIWGGKGFSPIQTKTKIPANGKHCCLASSTQNYKYSSFPSPCPLFLTVSVKVSTTLLPSLPLSIARNGFF